MAEAPSPALKRPRPARKGQAEVATNFWDQPVLMDLVSDLLFVLAIAALAWAAITALQRMPVSPLRQVVVAGPVDQVSRGQIEYVARTALTGNFFTVNLDAARSAFEKLPWVRRADVRRIWPDSLELAIEEHVAVARWQRAGGELQLVNTHGEVFAATPGAEAGLPGFAGPEGSSARVLERYHEFEQALLPLGRHPVAVVLTPREAWQIRLDDGVVVDLGRDQAKHALNDRLARFVTHYPAARQKLGGLVAVADMRYPNGFALRPARKG